MFSTKQNISQHFFSFAGVQRESKEDQEKENKEKDGSDKATKSCSHGFSLRWQKLLGDPVCTGVTDMVLLLHINIEILTR